MKINDFRAIETFIKAVDLGSLRRAAIAQGMSPQAASKALAQLEQRLGVRLLHRTTRSISTTEEGQRFLESTRPALAVLERAIQQAHLGKDEIAGPLRIVAPRTAFLRVLWPLVDEFCGLYPDVQPDLHLDDGIGNWVQERVDVGFRLGSPPAEGLIARRLFTMQLIVCAAPAYLDRYGAPNSIDELQAHRCSVFRHPTTGRTFPWFLKVDGSVTNCEVPPFLSTNDEDAELEAVLSGRVIGLLAAGAAAGHIRSGRLVPLLTQHAADNLGVHLYYGSRTAQTSRVRAFIDLAVQRLTDPPAFVFTPKALALAEAKGRKAMRR